MSVRNGYANIRKAAAELAGNHAKACGYVDALMDRVDQLVAAATRRDWNELRQQSRQLANDSQDAGFRSVSAMAQKVSDEAAKPDNELGTRRSLIRLIGTAGRASRPDAGSEGEKS